MVISENWVQLSSDDQEAHSRSFLQPVFVPVTAAFLVQATSAGWKPQSH